MPVIRSLLTHFGFKIESGKLQNFQKQVGATKGQLRVAARESRNMGRQIRGIGNMARYAVAAFVGSRLVKTFTTGFSEGVDAAAKMSKAMGINVETYQGLGHAARLSGASIEDVGKSMMQLGKRARDASEGSKKQRDAFRELGLEIKDSSGNLKNQDVLLMEVADRFKKMPDGTTKTALAMEVFGRAGAKIIPLLNEGSKGINAMMLEARQLGIVLSKEDAKAAEEFNDQLLRSKAAFQGLRNAIAREILPYLTRLLRGFQQWYREGDNAVKLLGVLKAVAIAAGIALAGIVTAKVIGLFKGFYGAVKSAIIILKSLGAAGTLAKIKLYAMLAIIILLVLIVEDLWRFARGDKSLIGKWLGEDSEQAKELRKNLQDLGKALIGFWRELKPHLFKVIKALVPVFINLLKVIVPILPTLANIFVKSLNFLAKALAFVTEWATWLTVMAKEYEQEIGYLKKIWEYAQWIISPFTALYDLFTDLVFHSNLLSQIWETMKSVWNTLGNAIKIVANTVESIWKKTIGWIWNQIEKIIQATEGVVSKLGIGKIGAGLFENISKATNAQIRKSMNQQNRISVGTISVNVSGSADMGSEEFQKAVQTGTADALNNFVSDAFSNLRPVTT